MRSSTALQKNYDATVDFVADFRQETEVKTLNRSLKASGKLSFKRPGKMLWRYDEPKGQFVLADGKHLYFYQPEQNQVIKSPLKNAFRGDIPLSFLLGLGNLKKDFNATLKAATRIRMSCAWNPRAKPEDSMKFSSASARHPSDIRLGKRARCGQQFDDRALFRHAQRRRRQGLVISSADSQRRRCGRTRPMSELNKNSASSASAAPAIWSIPKSWPGCCRRTITKWCSEPADADIVLVNTCGFIGAAKEESIDTIVEMWPPQRRRAR